jgi:hypothetical protein
MGWSLVVGLLEGEILEEGSLVEGGGGSLDRYECVCGCEHVSVEEETWICHWELV